MALAARREGGLLDPEAPAGQSPFDHHVYVIASDGDMMEGISSEASSLAGHQELGSLIVFYANEFLAFGLQPGSTLPPTSGSPSCSSQPTR